MPPDRKGVSRFHGLPSKGLHLHRVTLRWIFFTDEGEVEEIGAGR